MKYIQKVIRNNLSFLHFKNFWVYNIICICNIISIWNPYFKISSWLNTTSCYIKLAMREKVWSKMNSNFFQYLALWFIWCDTKSKAIRKLLSCHTKSISIRICWKLIEKALSQWLHLYGFSPVCILTCSI